MLCQILLLISWRCKHICCREGLEKPPKAHKRKHDVIQLGRPSQLTSGTEIAALLDDGAADYIPRMTQIKRNTRPRSPELISRLRKGGIEIVDLVNEDWRPIPHTPGKTQMTKKLPSWKDTRARVSITSSKPNYSYTNMDQPDLSILTPNAKAHDDNNLPSPDMQMLVEKSIDLTGSPHALLFGSGDFVDSDPDYGFVNVTDPVTTNSSHRANDYGKDVGSAPPSPPPLQEPEGGKNSSPHPPKVQKNLTLKNASPGKEKPRASNWGASPCLCLHFTLAYTRY